jgi:hypothetical protein
LTLFIERIPYRQTYARGEERVAGRCHHHLRSDLASSARVAALRHDPAFVTLWRSLDIYYGDAERNAAMDALYARFIEPGDLAFDIGAHVGNRIGSFRRLGARVLAVEPQPLCTQIICTIYVGDDAVVLVDAACGDRAGTVTFKINSANPRLDSLSRFRTGCRWRRWLGGPSVGQDN